MITDADWNEQADISKERLDAALDKVVSSGVPQKGGIVDLTGALPKLKWGAVYSDGIQGYIRPDLAQYVGVPPPGIDYLKQQDFPAPPVLPGDGNYSLYVDIWERTVISLQDDGMLDYGLHGADTCSRTQTMAQLKWCLPSVNPETDKTNNPSRGNAVIAVSLKSESASPDPCDPCATEVAIDAEPGNYLFRLEVHDIEGPPDSPTKIILKWSGENGAEAHAVGYEPIGFKQSKWIYEFFDETTEKHLGVTLANTDPKPVRGTLETDGYPNSVAGLPATVRRWDGYCELDLGAVTGNGKYLGAAVTPPYADGKLMVSLDTIEFEIALLGKQVVVGDYWLALVREQAPEVQKISVSKTPAGIIHHYVKIATYAAGTIVPFTNKEKRKLNFPSLTNVMAEKVGYDPLVKEERWKDINETISLGAPPSPNTVQDAIDDLIENLDSSDIGYGVPPCGDDDQPTVRTLMTMTSGDLLKVKGVLDHLLCKLFATTIPLDLDPAKLEPILVDPNVKTIQDALNVLSRKGGGQSCSVTVGPGGQEPDLPQAFASHADQENITFCLQPGNYTLPTSAGSGKNTIKIMGAGNQASVINVTSFNCAATEVIFRDLAFVGTKAAAALAIRAKRVTSEGCRFERVISFNTHDWSKKFIATGNSQGISIATDSQENAIIIGAFTNSINFGGKAIESKGDMDIFLAKFDKAGTHLWSHAYGGAQSEMGYEVCVDLKDHIIVTGFFNKDINFDGKKLTASGQDDIFLTKFDEKGNCLWAKQYGGPGSEAGQCMAIDLENNIILGGIFDPETTLDLGGEKLSGKGQTNSFLAKITADGKHVWSQGLDGDNITQIKKIAITPTNEIVVGGMFVGTIKGLGDIPLKSSTDQNVFIARFGENGSSLFGKTFNGTGESILNCLAIDKNENIILGGAFIGQIELGIRQSLKNPHDLKNTFLIVTDRDGDYRWAKTFTTSVNSMSEVTAVSVTDDNTIILTGGFIGPMDFGGKDFDSGESIQTFVAAFTYAGKYVWAKSFKPRGGKKTLKDNGGEKLFFKVEQMDGFGGDLAITRRGDVLLTGVFSSTINCGGSNISVNPNIDANTFLARLKIPSQTKPFVTLDRQSGQSAISKIFFRVNELNVTHTIDGSKDIDYALSIKDSHTGGHIQDNVCQGIISYNENNTDSLAKEIDLIDHHDINISSFKTSVFVRDNIISRLEFKVPDDFLQEGILVGTLEVPSVLKVSDNLFTEKGNIFAGKNLTVCGNNFLDGTPSQSKSVALVLSDTCMVSSCEAPKVLMLKSIALSGRFAESGNLLTIVQLS